VHSVVAIPGSLFVVSAGEDGVVRLHDIRDGRTVREISMGERTRVHALACNHDGKQLAIGYATQQESDAANSIKIVECENWESLLDWTGFPSTVESVTFSPDGKRLAIGCRYEPITIRSVVDADDSVSLASDRRNEEVLFSPDGNEVLVFDARDHLRLYDLHSGAVLQELNCQYQPHHLAWSSDGRWIAVSNFHHPFVLLFQPKNLSSSRVVLSQSFGGTNCIAFSPDSDRLIAGLRNGNVVSWNLTDIPDHLAQVDTSPTYSFEHVVPLINTSITAIACVSDDRLICGGENGAVAFCTFTKGYNQFLALDALSTRSAILTGDGQTIFMGTVDGSLVSFDVDTGQFHSIVSPKGTGLTKLALSSDQTFLGMGWDNGDLELMALPERKMLPFKKSSDQRVPPRPNIIDLYFQPESSRLILFRNSDQLQIWECSQARSEKQSLPTHVATIAAWETERLGSAVCYIPELEKLAYGGSSESVHQVGNGAPEQVLVANCSRVSSLLYDSARQVLISGHTNGIIQQHKLTGELIAFSRHAGVPILPSSNSVDVTKLSLSPDGRNLISGNVEGELRIWDASDLCSIGTIHEADGQGKISDICFSHDGKRLLYHQVVPEGGIRNGVHILDLE
ncbi:MAG TPA: WD40 repeat domain-containing protein, partial [Pirellula sp.]|nr:WD40 repeat domain-containing protein [Pirellula sp.]